MERGGLFDSLVESYKSATLTEVRRQKDWQKEVSESLSEGRFKEAFTTLEKHKAISWQKTKEDALHHMVDHWVRQHDPQNLKEHLLVAPLNKDVDALNYALQEYRFRQGELSHEATQLATQRGPCVFFKNDRICLTQTDKKRGLTNGQFGTIVQISPHKVTLKLDNKEDAVSFDPSSYAGLKLGYASTVYKSQGKTIEYVSVLHDPCTTSSLSYVSLSRQKSGLKLFVAQDKTPTLEALIQQSSRETRRLSSLEFTTPEEWSQKTQQPKTFLDHVKTTVSQWTEKVRTSVKDRLGQNEDFYKGFQKNPISPFVPQRISPASYLQGDSESEKETGHSQKRGRGNDHEIKKEGLSREKKDQQTSPYDISKQPDLKIPVSGSPKVDTQKSADLEKEHDQGPSFGR